MPTARTNQGQAAERAEVRPERAERMIREFELEFSPADDRLKGTTGKNALDVLTEKVLDLAQDADYR